MVGETTVRTSLAVKGWRYHSHRYRAVPALQFFRAHHRGRAQHHSHPGGERGHASFRQRRYRAGGHFVQHVMRGELVCVMGASGSREKHVAQGVGRADCSRASGQVLLNGQPLYPNLDQLKRYISYIPQEDAFDEHLTIGENLQFAAAIRSPHLSRRDRIASPGRKIGRARFERTARRGRRQPRSRKRSAAANANDSTSAST